jgi:hypothetical protein
MISVGLAFIQMSNRYNIINLIPYIKVKKIPWSTTEVGAIAVTELI